MNRFYNYRINIRTIIQAHLDIVNNENILLTQFNIVNLIDNIKIDLNSLFLKRYHKSPRIIFKYKSSVDNSLPKIIDTEYNDTDTINIIYIKNHLYYIIFEILKNSCKATIDNSYNSLNNDLSDIFIELIETNKEYIFKISDTGGGFNRDNINNLFSYFYKINNNKLDDKTISGWGHGLSLARVYSRYLGGELFLIPYENYGCECVIYINKFESLSESIDSKTNHYLNNKII